MRVTEAPPPAALSQCPPYMRATQAPLAVSRVFRSGVVSFPARRCGGLAITRDERTDLRKNPWSRGVPDPNTHTDNQTSNLTTSLLTEQPNPSIIHLPTSLSIPHYLCLLLLSLSSVAVCVRVPIRWCRACLPLLPVSCARCPPDSCARALPDRMTCVLTCAMPRLSPGPIACAWRLPVCAMIWLP